MQIEQWRMKQWRRAQWRKIGWAAGVGISVGILAGALSVHHTPVVRANVAPYIVPASVPAATVLVTSTERVRSSDDVAYDSQLERLKTRNRRLEALVTVLRRRAADRQ